MVVLLIVSPSPTSSFFGSYVSFASERLELGDPAVFSSLHAFSIPSLAARGSILFLVTVDPIFIL